MAKLDYSIAGNLVTFKVILESGDPSGEWTVILCAKTNRGTGRFCSDPQCEHYVQSWWAPMPTTWTVSLTPDHYCAVLDIVPIGNVDFATFDIAPVLKTQIFNICWDKTGKLVTGACPIPTSMPAVTPGTSIDIKADIANTGETGKVRTVFKIDGSVIADKENPKLEVYPGGGLWSPSVTYSMPGSNVKLTVESYAWDGLKWVQTDIKSVNISTTAPGCTGINLIPFSASIKAGEKVEFIISTSPGNIPFKVTLRDRGGAVIGQCTTSGKGTASGGSTCSIIWDSSGKSGVYGFKAYADSCISTESVISISEPIRQYDFYVTVLDNETGQPVTDAEVLVTPSGGNPQVKTTDASGFVTFRVDEGTISIQIRALDYNTINEAEYFFQDRAISYYLVPTPTIPTKGDLQFVSVPSGATIILDGLNTGQVTPITITELEPRLYNFTLAIEGFNDSNGQVKVVAGSVTPVYVTLSPKTPDTGSLNITSHPAMGAEVFIDDIDMNVKTSSGTIITNIPPGTHKLNLELPGYEIYQDIITIVAGTTMRYDAPLTPIETIGTLEINSDPSGARVFIDGEDTSRVTPATITGLIGGIHYYKIVLQGYKSIEDTFLITEGKTTRLEIKLEKTVGLGTIELLAAGAAAVAILGFMEKRE